MTTERLTEQSIEQEILEELFDNGDIVDDNFDRFYGRREGIISERLKEFAAQEVEAVEKQMDELLVACAEAFIVIAALKTEMNAPIIMKGDNK